MGVIYKNDVLYSGSASIEPIPNGGTTGQVLTKASDTDGDVTWSTPSGGSAVALTTSKVYDKDSTAAEFVPFVEGYLEDAGTTYTLYTFFYKTDGLPDNTSKIYDLSTLLADYTIERFASFAGMTSNGMVLNNGRTDSPSSVAIVQQGSKNNKSFTIRTYATWSGQTATVEIKFYGTKDT